MALQWTSAARSAAAGCLVGGGCACRAATGPFFDVAWPPFSWTLRGITIASCKASGAAGHYGRKAFSSMMAVNNGGPFRCRFPLRRCEMLLQRPVGDGLGGEI